MHRLMMLGLNHATARLDLREKLAFDSAQRDAALESLRQKFAGCEFVLLSTCNRVEIYVARPPHQSPEAADLAQFLAEARGVPQCEIDGHLYEKSQRQVVAHLFAVAASLDSMVLGETQILGQVRQAYDAACRLQTAGPMLNPLFQRALAVGKQILTETALAEGRLSIASVAVDCARRIFDTFGDKTALTIGAGKMASLMLAGLAELKPGKLLVCNRDPAKAAELARNFNGIPSPWENLADHLAAADIVLTSTGSATPILTKPMFELVMRRRRFKPMFLIDIAVPRDVAPEVGDVQNVYLYNLDDLQQVVSATRSQRGAELDAANQILAQHVEQFADWHRARELGPLIEQLHRRWHAVAQEELERTLGKLPEISAQQRAHLEELSRRIVNKLLHDPIRQMHNSQDGHAPQMKYLHAIEKLFGLDEPPQEPKP
ncbi:MAG: glutamyl-tRNA reductase [Tepidisphaeraceae bacterium]|jgi:glutamyl-tRNA reductase